MTTDRSVPVTRQALSWAGAMLLVLLVGSAAACTLKPPCKDGEAPGTCLPYPPSGPLITPGGVFAPESGGPTHG